MFDTFTVSLLKKKVVFFFEEFVYLYAKIIMLFFKYIFIEKSSLDMLPNISFCSWYVAVAQQESIVLAAQKVVGSIPKELSYWQKKLSLKVALDKSVC